MLLIVSILVHFAYFVVYYSKYSSCFHKLASLDSLEKAKIYEQPAIDSTRKNTWVKIKKLKKISYYPVLGITFFHLLLIYVVSGSGAFIRDYLIAIYIMAGSLVFIFLANVTQGSKILPGDQESDFFGPNSWN